MSSLFDKLAAKIDGSLVRHEFADGLHNLRSCNRRQIFLFPLRVYPVLVLAQNVACFG
ncbi:hypothetical protein BN128_4627 [Cronobacter sakazakii 696]|nr:hypothetical protein BN129_3375 [Cronobacter sakazakii 701]CCK09821.1 hypothetical protein BN128_4627 [Cronobacter sakazakii 696]